MNPATARRAVIDAGTNSVKLLVADVSGGEVTALVEKSRQTRLGEGFYREHRLLPGPIQRTAEAVKMFAVKARDLGASTVMAFATSAAREALNREELRTAVRLASGLDLTVISGDQEAEWGFRGVLTHPKFAADALAIFDLGGGSFQIILGHHGHAVFGGSFPLGCVRLLEQCRPSDPPSKPEKHQCAGLIKDFLKQRLAPALDPHLRSGSMRNCCLVGTGGTAAILGRMETGIKGFDRERIESARLSSSRVKAWRDRLWSLTLEERRQIPGLPANRADVILMGTAIIAAMMEDFGWSELRLSTRGSRFGAVLEAGERGAKEHRPRSDEAKRPED